MLKQLRSLALDHMLTTAMIRINDTFGGQMAELLYPLDEGGDERTQGWRPEDLVDRSDALRLSYAQVESRWRRIRQCLVEDRFHVQLAE